MAENKKTIVIDDETYTEDDFNNEQKMMLNHIADLERKIGSTQFNLDQLNVGKAAFIDMLKASMAEETKVEAAE
jgi:hypothetical protein